MIRQLASIGCCDFMLSHLISMLSHLWKVLSQLVFQEHCVEHRTVASSLHKCRICSPAHGAIIAGVPQAPQPLLLARPCTSATTKLQLTQATESMKRRPLSVSAWRSHASLASTLLFCATQEAHTLNKTEAKMSRFYGEKKILKSVPLLNLGSSAY